MTSIKSVIWFWRRLRGAMLNDLIRGFGQKLRETIRPEICFRLVVFLDASRLADVDLEKTTVELLLPQTLSTVSERWCSARASWIKCFPP